MEQIEALKMALSREIESEQLYKDMSVKYPESKEVFTLLMNEERKHQQLIQGLVDSLMRRV